MNLLIIISAICSVALLAYAIREYYEEKKTERELKRVIQLVKLGMVQDEIRMYRDRLRNL